MSSSKPAQLMYIILSIGDALKAPTGYHLISTQELHMSGAGIGDLNQLTPHMCDAIVVHILTPCIFLCV